MAAPTTATFHLPHSWLAPLELTVKMPSLAMAVVPRDAVGALDEKWAKAIGVYVLLGPPGDNQYDYRCYAGQSGTGGLKQRLGTHRNSANWEKRHHLPKEWWTRALIVRSRDEEGFNSAEAGWLEGRLWDILDGAPAAQLVGKKGDDQTLPQHDRERLEQYMPAITAVLRAIGASPDTPDQHVKPKRVRKHNATVADLIKAELLTPGVKLRSLSSLHEVIAVVGDAGELIVDGKTYDSPSGAAVAVAGHEMNGWTFWGFQSGDGTLVPLSDLRAQLEPGKAAEGAPKPIETTPAAPTQKKEREKEKEKEKEKTLVTTAALKTLVDAGLIPTGAIVFATFKGGRREATVDADGCLHLDDGSVHRKPSGAARAVTGYETNGWNFWRIESEGKTVPLKTLREELDRPR
jgi:hypothetical protein